MPPYERWHWRRSSRAEGPHHTSLGHRPRTSCHPCDEGLKARPIPRPPATRSCSIPHIRLIMGHAVFVQECAELFLERARPVMLLLIIDVAAQGLNIRRPDGEASITPLPGESAQLRCLGLEPLGGSGLQCFDQSGDGDRARHPQREMNVIGHATHAVAFAPSIPRHSGEIRMEVGTDAGAKTGKAVPGAEDDVDDHEAEGLGHGAAWWRGPSALPKVFSSSSWGSARFTRLPQAGMERAFGPELRSDGGAECPSLWNTPGCGARIPHRRSHRACPRPSIVLIACQGDRPFGIRPSLRDGESRDSTSPRLRAKLLVKLRVQRLIDTESKGLDVCRGQRATDDRMNLPSIALTGPQEHSLAVAHFHPVHRKLVGKPGDRAGFLKVSGRCAEMLERSLQQIEEEQPRIRPFKEPVSKSCDDKWPATRWDKPLPKGQGFFNERLVQRERVVTKVGRQHVCPMLSFT